MNHSAQWFLLVIALFVGNGTAWGQTVSVNADGLDSEYVGPMPVGSIGGIWHLNLRRPIPYPTTKPTIRSEGMSFFTARIGPASPTMPHRFVEGAGWGLGSSSYTATGSPPPIVTLTCTRGAVRIVNEGGGDWLLTFSKRNVGTNTFTATAKNRAGSASITFTVVITWIGTSKPLIGSGRILTINTHVPETWPIPLTNRVVTAVRDDLTNAVARGVPHPSQRVQRLNLRSKHPPSALLRLLITPTTRNHWRRS